MIRKSPTPVDKVLIKRREMTGRTQTLAWWLGGEGVKTTENKILWPLSLNQKAMIKKGGHFFSYSKI
jgi:hypothetical protein